MSNILRNVYVLNEAICQTCDEPIIRCECVCENCGRPGSEHQAELYGASPAARDFRTVLAAGADEEVLPAPEPSGWPGIVYNGEWLGGDDTDPDGLLVPP